MTTEQFPDPYEYGKLVAQVEAMEKKIDKLEVGMEALLALANKSRGGFFAGMMVISAVSAFVGYLTHYWAK
jgi:hypothetical protein